jgi:hypothetical protein
VKNTSASISSFAVPVMIRSFVKKKAPKYHHISENVQYFPEILVYLSRKKTNIPFFFKLLIIKNYIKIILNPERFCILRATFVL